jgi:hypothetical protein
MKRIECMKRFERSFILLVLIGALSAGVGLSTPLAHAAVFHAYMGIGSKGTEVRALQQLLIDKGYLVIPSPTGVYGKGTARAVQTFQTTRGIRSTGYVGPSTIAALNSANVFPAPEKVQALVTPPEPIPDVTPTDATTLAKISFISSLTAQLQILQAQLAAILSGQVSPAVITHSSGGGGGGGPSVVAPTQGSGGSGVPTPIIPVIPAPTITFSADLTSIAQNGTTTLSWTTTDATSCTASGGWSGTQATSSSQTFGNLTQSQTYTLTCTGGGGSATQSLSVVVAAPPVAPSYSVYPGCAVPSSTIGNAFYVDATNGNDSTGNGSLSKPWKTLQTVIDTKVATNKYTNGVVAAVNASGPIHPGDTIYLKTGNYGALSVKGLENSDFITVTAAPGATPVLSTLAIYGQKWIFSNLSIISTKTQAFTNLVQVLDNSLYGPNSNIILDHNTISSSPGSLASWTLANWQSSAVYRGIILDKITNSSLSKCMSLTSNAISMVNFAMVIEVDSTLFEQNTIDGFGDDGVDIAANNVKVSNNLIVNSLDLADGNHNDAIQGYPGRNTASSTDFSNVLIQGNVVIRQTNPALPQFNGHESTLQGISAFDEDWNNLQVLNNLVVVNSYHGLSFASVHGGVIASNTVLNDGTIGPNDSINAAPDNYQTFIDINNLSHEGTSTNNLIVENNIADIIEQNTASSTFMNNVAGIQFNYFPTATSTIQNVTTNGVYGNNNVVNTSLHSYFTNFDPVNNHFNVTLLAGVPIAGNGTTLTLSGVGAAGTNNLVSYRTHNSWGGQLASIGTVHFLQQAWLSIVHFLGQVWTSITSIFSH